MILYKDDADLVVDLQAILTELYERKPFTNYVHRNDYESLWAKNLCYFVKLLIPVFIIATDDKLSDEG
ncbi:9368_t:CDS:2 [Entrophospora sp. SA101]|nr:9368_t:CDS:2 [Entrophospora sp. SA101]